MATIPDDEAAYWAERAERELQLARQCNGLAASSHRARASRFRDLEHKAIRQCSVEERPGQTLWF
jgi:hypothetical protein